MPDFAKAMEDTAWTSMLQEAFTKEMNDLREVEIAYTRIMSKLGVEAKDRIFKFFVDNGPAVARCVTAEATEKIIFLIAKMMSE